MIAVYGFNAAFEPAILSGTKGCTIRAVGKRMPPLPGRDVLRLYVGLRTKACRLVLETAMLAAVPVEMRLDHGTILVDGCRVRDLDAFSRFDGFDDFDGLANFREGVRQQSLRRHEPVLPRGCFSGLLIQWLPFPPGIF
jgi:hypothetical protein